MAEDIFSDPPNLSGIAKSLSIQRGQWSPGHCSVFVDVEEFHCNKGGVAHGGLFTIMLDMACGGALVSGLLKEEWCATTQLNVSFIDAGRIGERLEAVGNVTRRGRNVAHLSGEIRAESGRLIASATGTWMIWQSKPDKFPGRESDND